MVDHNFFGNCTATLCNRRQCEQEKWREVVTALPRFVQRRQVGVFVVVVVVGQADHHQVVDAGTPHHKCFHSAGRAPIAIAEGVHRADMVVGSQCLDNAIVLSKRAGNGPTKRVKSSAAIIASCNAATPRRPKGHIPRRVPQRARFTSIIVTTGHNAPVNFQDELGIDGPIGRLQTQPAVRGIGGSQLPLGIGQMPGRVRS